MAPDEYQQAWQSQTVQASVTVNADQLLKEVQRSQQRFRSMIFGRDVIEVGISLLMIPVWFYLGARSSLPWTWYLTVPVLVWIAGFMLVDRMRHPRHASEPGESLRHCVKESLSQVEHQIWLLRNVFWWYLFPPTISIMAFFTQVCWQASATSRALGAGGWLEFLVGLGTFSLVLLVVYGAVYFVNQRAVRVQLEPQRQELLTLLTSLRDEANGVGAQEIDISVTVSPFAENGFIRGAGACTSTPRRAVRIAIGLFALAVCGGIVAFIVAVEGAGGPEQTTVPGIDRPSPVSSQAEVSLKPAQSSGPKGDALAALVTNLRKQKKLVGLAAMVMVDGKVDAVAAHGERKIRSGVPVQIGDRWHMGGATNSVTATMIGRLVEAGQMNWTDTVGEVFPEAPIHEDWKPVTIKQLLTHTGGAARSFSMEVRKKRPARGSESTQARQQAVLHVMSNKPEYPPGTRFGYSLVSLPIAGAMAERVTGDTWEDLVRQLVFEPLELNSAGFGPPKSSKATLEQPRGHRTIGSRKYAMSDQADNTPIMGPAGTVHMTLHDLCSYATEHMRGYFREGTLLSTETYRVLHTPELRQYACGWMRKRPDGKIPHAVYWHNGSNTMWYAMVAFIPERNMVVAVTSNDGETVQAEAAAWEIVKASVMSTALQAELPE